VTACGAIEPRVSAASSRGRPPEREWRSSAVSASPPPATMRGPARVRVWLAGKSGLPAETRNYVAIVTGWTADEWASHSPPQAADATIPPGVPCARLANLVLGPKEEANRIASYVPRWAIPLAAHLLESKAWEMYRERQNRYASLISDHEPVVLYKQIPAMGRAKRYIITIAGDDRAPLDRLCKNMIAAGVICDVLRN
jgi:hypothetical protein